MGGGPRASDPSLPFLLSKPAQTVHRPPDTRLNPGPTHTPLPACVYPRPPGPAQNSLLACQGSCWTSSPAPSSKGSPQQLPSLLASGRSR